MVFSRNKSASTSGDADANLFREKTIVLLHVLFYSRLHSSGSSQNRVLKFIIIEHDMRGPFVIPFLILFSVDEHDHLLCRR